MPRVGVLDRAATSVAAAMPPLLSEASTEGTSERADSSSVVVMLTMWPPPCRSIGSMTRCVRWKKPPTLTLITVGVVVGRVVGERLGDEDARVVDQGVDPAEPVERGRDDLRRGGGVGHVAGHGDHAGVVAGLRMERGVGHHGVPDLAVGGSPGPLRCPGMRR